MHFSVKTKLLALTFVTVVISAMAILYITMGEREKLYRETVIDSLDSLASNLSADMLQLLASQESLQETLNAETNDSSTNLELPIASQEPDLIAITTKLLNLDRYQHIKYAAVYDPEYIVIQNYFNPQFVGFSEGENVQNKYNVKAMGEKPTVLGDELVILKPIGEQAYYLGFLLIVVDYQTPLSNSINESMAKIMPLALVTLLVTLLLSNWLNGSIIGPLIKLSNWVQKVGESHDYKMRIKIEGNDEISSLGQNINTMLSTIDEQNIATEKHHNDLLAQQESLEQLANYDPLTSLPNRKFFMEILRIELARVSRTKNDLAIMFLDLDDFKSVNDTLGHHAGDALLEHVSSRISECLRDCDVLGRLGGDEFVVLLNQIEDELTTITVAERIIDSFSTPIKIIDWDVHTGVSIGIAYSKSAKYDLDTLISNADVAMYQAKNAGRGTFVLFHEKMQSSQNRRMLIANELIKAIKESAFELVYHPKVSPDKGVIGLEALIRWNSHFEGYISPGEFIPVAEHSGRITDITRWVIQNGFEHVANMRKQLPDVVVSFNVSSFDIVKSDFIEFIQSQLDFHQLDPSLIEFEVTESAYITNFDTAKFFLDEVKLLGCSIALDDFGTGYSSLSYLTHVDADIIKIDQQFIRNMFASKRDNLIVETIINLSKSLGLKICAEGVETSQQYSFLVEAGCQQIQGYYFSKPLPLEELYPQVEAINQSVKEIHQQPISVQESLSS